MVSAMLARAIINAVTRTRFNFRQTSRIKNTTPTTSTAHINKTTYCSAWQLSDQQKHQRTKHFTGAGSTGYRDCALYPVPCGHWIGSGADLKLPFLQAGHVQRFS